MEHAPSIDSFLIENDKSDVSSNVSLNLKTSSQNRVTDTKMLDEESNVVRNSSEAVYLNENGVSVNEDAIRDTTTLLSDQVETSVALVKDTNSYSSKFYSGAECTPKLQKHQNKNDYLLPAPSSSPSYNCKLHSSSRNSSVQFKKLSLRSSGPKPSNEKRLTLLGKPIVTGVKNKPNYTYR